jgi:hypothetical protein
VLIVDTALHSFLLSMPQAAAIWLIMLAVALVAVAALSTPGRRRPTDDPAHADGEPRRRAGRRARAAAAADDRDWTRRYADEVAIAAERATVTAHRARAAWEAAHDTVDHAWRTFDAADRAARRAAQAVAFPIACPVRTPAEFADHERYLHRAATAACRRQELTVDDLNDVLAHRSGWDPRLPPVHQEAFLRRVVRDRLFRAYREAQHLEKRAWHAAGVASAAMCSLREEAAAAALRAGTVRVVAEPTWWAEQWATDAVRETVPVPAPADIDATQPVRVPVPSGGESTQPLLVPAQTRAGRRTQPHPAHVRSVPPVRQPAVAGAGLAAR